MPPGDRPGHDRGGRGVTEQGTSWAGDPVGLGIFTAGREEPISGPLC